MYDKLTATFIAALLVLSGGSAFALATGVHEDVTENSTVGGETDLQQQPTQVLVFADDYTPETSFEVITRLKQGAVRDILGQTVDDRPVISNTADYTGYVVRLHSSEDVPGEYGLVFVHRDTGRLMPGAQYQFTTDSTFFRVDVNLLQTGIRSVEGGTATEEGTPTSEDGTPTPTPEDATPTPEEGTPTPTPTPEGDTPTPEAGGIGGNETAEVAEETTEAVATEEAPTAAEAGGDGGLISSITDFLGGLFDGGGDEGGQRTTTVEGGGAS